MNLKFFLMLIMFLCFSKNVLVGQDSVVKDLCAKIKLSHVELLSEVRSSKKDRKIKLTNAFVDCDKETVIYMKKLEIEIDQISKPLIEDFQKQHTRKNCSKGLPSSTNFTVVDFLYNSNELFSILITKPIDCK